MNLSIIIVNYRSWDCLEECLSSVLSEAGQSEWEIIVVDNHSDDGRLEEFQARFEDVRFIGAGRNGGFAFGCNLGAESAHGETYLFLNPDVVTQPGSVSAMLEVKENNPGVTILSTGQLDGRGRQRKVFDMFPDKLTWFRIVKFLLRRLRPGRFPNPRLAFTGLLDCDWVSGSVLMIGADDFRALGGWREDYWMYMEDCDLCLRARRKNMRVACSGDVWMTHYHGGASRQTPAISVLTRTEAIVSKHLYVHLNFRRLDRAINHLCVFLEMFPKLLIYSCVDLLTFRRIKRLRTRSGVFLGVMAHYGHVIRTRSWQSRQIQRAAQAAGGDRVVQ